MGSQRMHWGVYCRAALVAAGVCGLVRDAGAVSEAYLSAVRAEIDEMTSGQFVPPPGSPWVRTVEEPASLGVSSPQYKEFEALMRARMPGTFVQFRRIHLSKRIELFRRYVVDGDMEQIRHSILETLR